MVNEKEIIEFEKLINHRICYIKSLSNLENWCNGNCFVPRNEIIYKSINFLEILEEKVRNKIIEMLNLVISPIPQGGICIELAFSKIEFSVSMFNDNKIQVEYCKNNSYFELKNITFEKFIYLYYNYFKKQLTFSFFLIKLLL